MAEKEMQNADVCTNKNKIKTNFAKIFVSGTPDRPCFNILYFDPEDQNYHIGFSSYCLEYVFKWLSEEFEIEDALSADVAPVRHGRWIGKHICGNCNCRYSECGSWHHIHATLRGEIMQKYCPNCGAKMDESVEDDKR